MLKQKQLEIEEAKHKRAEEDLKETEISKIPIFLYFFLFGFFLVILLFDKLFLKRLFKRLSFHDRYMKFTSRYVELAKSVRETEKKICCQNSTFSHLSESQMLT